MVSYHAYKGVVGALRNQVNILKRRLLALF